MSDPVIYVVVKKGGYDKDVYIAAYLERFPADRHRFQLGGEADPDDDFDYAVWTIPLRTSPPERMTA